MYSVKKNIFIFEYYRGLCVSADGFVYIYSKNTYWKILFLCSVHPLILTELTLFSQVQFADTCGWPGLAGVITIFRNLLDIVPVRLKP